jgi:hypothetical protein
MLPVAVTLKGIPFICFVVVLAMLAGRRRRRWASLLEDADVVSALVVSDLRTWRSSRRAVAATRDRAGEAAASILQRLQAVLLETAMLLDRGGADDPSVSEAIVECRALEGALDAIPGAAAASG